MHIPWFFACFPAFLTIPAPALVPADTLALSALRTGEQVQQVQRETRGFGIQINHARREITIQAWFFAARRDADAVRQLQAILHYWDQQNGRFVYQLKQDGQRLRYRVIFDLRAAPGTYGEAGFFLPASEVPIELLNQVEVVPREQFDRLDWPRRKERVVGYAPNNFIYIASDQAQETWIGIHEAGHRLGMGHHSLSAMAPELSPQHSRLPRQAIRELLATANIIGRGLCARKMARYPVKAASVEHIGEVPQGFFTQGKVKRN